MTCEFTKGKSNGKNNYTPGCENPDLRALRQHLWKIWHPKRQGIIPKPDKKKLPSNITY